MGEERVHSREDCMARGRQVGDAGWVTCAAVLGDAAYSRPHIEAIGLVVLNCAARTPRHTAIGRVVALGRRDPGRDQTRRLDGDPATVPAPSVHGSAILAFQPAKEPRRRPRVSYW